MTVLIARVAIVLVLILAIAVGVQTWRLARATDREVYERSERQMVELVAAGWEKAAKASQAQLSRIVPELEAELAAAKKAGALTAGTSHWEGHASDIPIPCAVVMGPPSGISTPAMTAPPMVASEAPPVVSVTPYVKIDDAIALDDAGGIYVARKVAARLAVGTKWTSDWTPVEPDAGSTTAVSPDLIAAWKAYRNPPPKIGFVRSPKQWRAGLSCGVGLGYGVRAEGIDAVAACLYGVQF